MPQKIATIFRSDVRRSVVRRPHQKTTPMRLKAAITHGLVLPLILLASWAASPVAAAVWTNHSGTICKNYNYWEATLVDYFTDGTRSLVDSDSTPVICPLTRNTANSTGATVYVAVTHYGERTTTCTAYSYSRDGTLRASASQTWTGPDFHEFVLNLVGSGKSSAQSDYSVYCSIPGRGNGLVRSVDLSEE
jgi:hypothetical protein